VAKIADIKIVVVPAARLDDIDITQHIILDQLVHIRRALTDQENIMSTTEEGPSAGDDLAATEAEETPADEETPDEPETPPED
jgi:hypothetical protein